MLIFVVVTMVSLRQQLDEDERHESLQGHSPPPPHNCQHVHRECPPDQGAAVSFFCYISCAVTKVSLRRELRLKEQEAIKVGTVAGGLVEHRKLLAENIREFWIVQKVYMPELTSLLDEADDDFRLDVRPEFFKLMLPSQLTHHDHESWCLPGLSILEARFQYAQVNDALAEIRRLRQLFQGLSDQNRKHITTSQGTVTRGKGTFERYKARILRSATLYQQAHHTLSMLDLNSEITQWSSRFLELDDTDICGPGREGDATSRPSEGHTIPSWIWLVLKPPVSLSIPRPDAEVNNSTDPNKPDLSSRAASGEEVAVSIRAHWARCQARAERHEEEVQLTVEEMRRTLEFFKWKSRWWLTLQDSLWAQRHPLIHRFNTGYKPTLAVRRQCTHPLSTTT